MLKRRPGCLWAGIVAGVIFFALPRDTRSDDGYGTFGIGGLQLEKTDSIALKKELLVISSDNVAADFFLTNESDRTQSSVIFFPLPAIRPGTLDKTDFPKDFTTTVNEKPIPVEVEQRVFLGERELTKDFSALGLLLYEPGAKQLFEANAFPPKATRQRAKEIVAQLRQRGLLPTESSAGGPTGCDNYAADRNEIITPEVCLLYDFIQTENLEFRVKFWWNQEFKPKETLHIRHTYNPSPGLDGASHDISYIDPYRGHEGPEGRRKSYCLLGSGGHYVDYVLTTANSWKNGIEDFELSIRGPLLVAATIAGQDIWPSFHEIRVTKKNFKPAGELIAWFSFYAGEPPYKCQDQPDEYWTLLDPPYLVTREAILLDSPVSGAKTGTVSDCEILGLIDTPRWDIQGNQIQTQGWAKVRGRESVGWIASDAFYSTAEAGKCKDRIPSEK